MFPAAVSITSPRVIARVLGAALLSAFGVGLIVFVALRLSTGDPMLWATRTGAAGASAGGFVIAGARLEGWRELLFPYSAFITFAFGLAALICVPRMPRTARIELWVCAAAFALAACAAFALVAYAAPHAAQPSLGAVTGVCAALFVRMLQLHAVLDRVRSRLDPLVGGGARAGSLDGVLTVVESRFQRVDQTQSLAQTQLRETAAQDERNRLARDLHDTIKQQLFSINMAAATAQSLFDNDPAGAREMVQEVRNLTGQAQVEMKALLTQLRPEPLATIGLAQAIGDQLEALHFRSELKTELQAESLPEADRLPVGSQEAIFRIAQEALSNVARHARARTVRVELSDDDKHFTMRVIDDGQGFDPAAQPVGMGVGNMRTRIAELGGALTLTSAPGKGTTLTVIAPLVIRATAMLEPDRQHLLDRWSMTMLVNSISYLGLFVISVFVGAAVYGVMSVWAGSAPSAVNSNTAPVQPSGAFAAVLALAVIAVVIAVPLATVLTQIYVRLKRRRLAKLADRYPAWGEGFKRLLALDDFWNVANYAGIVALMALYGRAQTQDIDPIASRFLGGVLALSATVAIAAVLLLLRDGAQALSLARDWVTRPWLRARLIEWSLNFLLGLLLTLASFSAQSVAMADSWESQYLNALSAVTVIASTFTSLIVIVGSLRAHNAMPSASALAVGARTGLLRSDRMYFVILLISQIPLLLLTYFVSSLDSLPTLIWLIIMAIVFNVTRSLSPLTPSLPELSDPKLKV